MTNKLRTELFDTREDWDAAVKSHGLEISYLQYGLVEAHDRDGQYRGAWFNQYNTPNGISPYGTLKIS